jgi:hypothetical protein
VITPAGGALRGADPCGFTHTPQQRSARHRTLPPTHRGSCGWLFWPHAPTPLPSPFARHRPSWSLPLALIGSHPPAPSAGSCHVATSPPPGPRVPPPAHPPLPGPRVPPPAHPPLPGPRVPPPAHPPHQAPGSHRLPPPLPGPCGPPAASAPDQARASPSPAPAAWQACWGTWRRRRATTPPTPSCAAC